MKAALYAIAALVLVALGALLLAPATLIDGWLRDRTHGRLAMPRNEGTLWSGNGELSMSLQGARVLVLPELRWKVSPWSLFGGALEGTISGRSAPSGPIKGSFRIERHSMEVRDLGLTVPAEALATLAAVAALSPSGRVSIEIDSLRWAPPGSVGGGRILWHQASLILPEDRSRFGLGTVELQFSAQGDRFAYTMSNLDGEATLEGQGEWRPGSAPSVNATISANVGTPESLALALSRMAGAAGGAVVLRIPAGLPSAR